MKSTKIIAGLGVVAALGIAALPFGGVFADARTDTGTGATVTTQDSSDDADVTVQVLVDDTIAIRVTGTQNIYTWDSSAASGAGAWVASAQPDQADFDGTYDDDDDPSTPEVPRTPIEGPITAVEMTNNDFKTLKNNVYVTTNSGLGYNLYVKANDSANLRRYVWNPTGGSEGTGAIELDADAATTDHYIAGLTAKTALVKGQALAQWGLYATHAADAGTGADPRAGVVATNFSGSATAAAGTTHFYGAATTSASTTPDSYGALVYTSGNNSYNADLTEITYGVTTSATQVSGLYQASLTYTAAIYE